MSDNNITLVSEAINNYNYAPGIATYGALGIQGTQGSDGNCIFFTTYNIVGNEDLDAFKLCMQLNKLPIRNGEVIDRKFRNGDYFFDRFGNILELVDYNSLVYYPLLTTTYTNYFSYVGKIKPSVTLDNIFTEIENSARISLNSNYMGVDINSADIDVVDSTTTNYPLRIISGNLSGDNIELLHGTAYYNYNKLSDIKIYYDVTNNIWHLDSEDPIVLDSRVQVNEDADDNVDDVDGYSSVITSKTPMTVFYNYAQQLTWSYYNTYYIRLNGLDDIELPEDIQNNMRIKIVKSDGTTYIRSLSNLSTKFSWQTSKTQTVSVIYNIEVYLSFVKATTLRKSAVLDSSIDSNTISDSIVLITPDDIIYSNDYISQ